jgi:hypothetical protein
MSAYQSDRSQYLVRPPCQLAEHVDRVGPIAGFPENPTVHNNGCVGRQHRQWLTRSAHREGFLAGQPRNVSAGLLASENGFVDVRSRDNVGHANLGQELTPAGRMGGKANYGLHQSR